MTTLPIQHLDWAPIDAPSLITAGVLQREIGGPSARWCGHAQLNAARLNVDRTRPRLQHLLRDSRFLDRLSKHQDRYPRRPGLLVSDRIPALKARSSDPHRHKIESEGASEAQQVRARLEHPR